MKASKEDLQQVYELLLQHFGPRGWWPGDSAFEIIVGAVLTQAVAWKNVEKALAAMKEAGVFSVQAILQTPDDELSALIRPTLYHRQKTRKLKEIMYYVEHEYQGNIHSMFQEPMYILRQELLSIWGIGPETADSILLYAGNYPTFVVDAYTRRIFSRLGWVAETISYHKLQKAIQERVPEDITIYNEYHALLVAQGASYCKKTQPLCNDCPLSQICRYFISLQE